MKKYLVRILTCSAALAGLAIQAQTSQDTPPGTKDAGTSSSDSSSSSSQWRSRYGATGRMGQYEVRGSKLMNSDVKTGQGESLGKIEDVVINAASGRIDFAVISYNASSSTSSSTSATTTPSTSTTTPGTSSTSATGEKLVPIPFTMLRPQSMTGYSSSSTSSATTSTASTSSSGLEQQPTFVFTGDKSRLDNAPSFDRSSWPDLTQIDWRQRIFAHFGMQPGSATGGATTPGGTSTGTSDSSSTPDPSSTPK